MMSSRSLEGTTDEEVLVRWQGWTVVATQEGRLFFHHEPRSLSQWHQPPELRDVLGEWTEVTEEGGAEGPPVCYWRNDLLRISLWKDPRATTNIFQAALDGNIFFIKLYAEVEGQMNVVDPKGRSALHYASAGGATQSVGLLLQTRAEVDRRDEANSTPLIFACRYGYASVVKVLLDARADLNAAQLGGNTALHEASELGQLDCLHLLLLNGANATAVNADCDAPADVALKKRHMSCVTLLRRHLQNPPPRDAAGRRPLGHAAQSTGSKRTEATPQHLSPQPQAAMEPASPRVHQAPASALPPTAAVAEPRRGSRRRHVGEVRRRPRVAYAGGSESEEDGDGAETMYTPAESGSDAGSAGESSDGAGGPNGGRGVAGRSGRSGGGRRARERSPVALGLLSRWVPRVAGTLGRAFAGVIKADLGVPNQYRYSAERQCWELAP